MFIIKPYSKLYFFCCNLPVIPFLISACSITPYSTESMEKINWIVKNQNTKTGNLVKKRLASLSNSKGATYNVDISGEKIRQRTVGVDESGQPSTYLKEILIVLKVSEKGKTLISEPIITARQLSQKESSHQVSQQQKQMLNELANDILLRLNDVANQDKDELIHRQSVYEELRQHPKPKIAKEIE